MKKLILVLSLMAIPINAHAWLIIDEGLYFKDTVTNRTWWDLGSTCYLPYTDVENMIYGTDFTIAQRSDLEELRNSLLTYSEEEPIEYTLGLPPEGFFVGRFDEKPDPEYTSWNSVLSFTQSDKGFVYNGVAGKDELGQNTGTWVVSKRYNTPQTVSTPEPSTWLLMALGLIGFLFIKREREAM